MSRSCATIDKDYPNCYHIGMGYLTIQETVRYTGLSRQTILARLARGEMKGRKTGPDTSPWLIPAGEVERVRCEQLDDLIGKAKAISNPVPNGADGD